MHPYIYICIYQYFAPLSLSWLLFVPVSASGLFLPFPKPVMHLPSLLRTYRMKAKQWFQSKVWRCLKLVEWYPAKYWYCKKFARYCRIELEILRLVLGCLLTLDLTKHHTILQSQMHRICKDFYVGFPLFSMLLVEYFHGLQHWRQLEYL